MIDRAARSEFTGLRELRDHYISEQARKWLAIHPDYQTDKPPPDEATLPDYPHVTFGHVDECLQNMSGKYKPTLWKVLTEDSPPVIEIERVKQPAPEIGLR